MRVKKISLITLAFVLVGCSICALFAKLEEFSFNKEAFSIIEGYQLNVLTSKDLSLSVKPLTYLNNKTIVYKSDNENVVSIDENGNLKALHTGIAKITATLDDKSDFTNVTVVSNSEMDGIDIYASAVTLKVNEELNLHAQIKPYGAFATKISWQSNDTSIIDVKYTYGLDAKFIAKKNGVARITLTAENSLRSYTATLKITVSGEGKQVVYKEETITLKVSPIEITVKVGAKIPVTAEVESNNPEYDASDVVWSFEDINEIFYYRGDGIYAAKAGKADITASLDIGSRVLTAKCTVTVTN